MFHAEGRTYWAGRPVALTGATGFIGHHLTRRLLDLGADVQALVRTVGRTPRGVTSVPGSLENPDALRRTFRGCDVVFHLGGAVDFRNSEVVQRVNVGGTAAVLDAARACGVRRLVHVSSIVAVGASSRPTELDESATWNLGRYRLPYVTTKHAAERLVLSQSEVDAVVVNPSCVIGPDDHGPSEFGLLCKRYWQGHVRMSFGGGSNFVDVRDVVTGTVAAARLGAAGQRYLLTGENLRYADFYAALGAAASRRFRSVRLPCAVGRLMGWIERQTSRGRPYLAQAPLFGLYFYYRAEKARQTLGYAARPLGETLSDAYEFFFGDKSVGGRHAA